MKKSTCFSMGTHVKVLQKPQHLSFFRSPKANAVTVVLLFALLFSVNLQAQPNNKNGEDHAVRLKTGTTPCPAIPSTTTCAGCDGKVLDATKPQYKLVAPTEKPAKRPPGKINKPSAKPILL